MTEHASYSLTVLDKEGHPFGPALRVCGEDDCHAISEAKKYIGSHAAELFEGLRLVKRFDRKQ
jgi:hypothetical protein